MVTDFIDLAEGYVVNSDMEHYLTHDEAGAAWMWEPRRCSTLRPIAHCSFLRVECSRLRYRVDKAIDMEVCCQSDDSMTPRMVRIKVLADCLNCASFS